MVNFVYCLMIGFLRSSEGLSSSLLRCSVILDQSRGRNRETNRDIISVAVVRSCSFPVAQLVEHGVSNAKIMGSIPRESKS